MAVKKIHNHYSAIVQRDLDRYQDKLADARNKLAEYLLGDYVRDDLTEAEASQKEHSDPMYSAFHRTKDLWTKEASREGKKGHLEWMIDLYVERVEVYTTALRELEFAALEPIGPQDHKTHALVEIAGERWFYQDCVYEVKGTYSDEEKKLLVLEFADKERQQFERLKAKFSGEQAKIATTERKRIPEDVRVAVWRRDQGQCARCGNRENLEYDHIVPVSRGGSNTVRNIELLCERCNREKGDRIQ